MPSARARWKKVSLGILGTVLALLVAAVFLVAAVLWTPAGTRLALEAFSSWYGGRIAGTITVESTEGSLAGGLRLEGVLLGDSKGHPLVEVDAAELRLDPFPLLTKTLQVSQLRIDGVRVHAWPGEPGFADLSPPSAEPKPETPGFGPDLPFEVDATVAIEGAEFITHARDGAQIHVVHNAGLRAHISGDGQHASADIEGLHGTLPGADVRIAAATARARWDDPVAELEHLLVISDAGAVDQARARIDLAQETASVDLEGRVLPGGRVDPSSRLPIGEVAFEVEGEGRLDGLWIWAVVEQPNSGRIALAMFGRIEPEPAVVVLGAADVQWPSGARAAVPLLLMAGLSVEDQRVKAHTFVLGRGDKAPPVTVMARAAGDLDTKRFTVEADLSAPSTHVQATAQLEDGALQQAEAHVSVARLERIAEAIAPYTSLPDLRGALLASATCRPSGDLRHDGTELRCRIDASGNDLRISSLAIRDASLEAIVKRGADALTFQGQAEARLPTDQGLLAVRLDAEGSPERIAFAGHARRNGDRGAVVGEVDPGPPLRIGLRELDVHARRLRAKLLAPTEITVSAEAIDIGPTVLALAGGRLLARGRVSFAGRSDLEASLRGIELAQLSSIWGDPALSGTVDGRLAVEGRSSRPRADVVMTGTDLVWNDQRLGDLELRAAYDHAMARAELTSKGSPLGEVYVLAKQPVRINLASSRKVRVLYDRPFALSIDMRRGNLEDIAALLETPHEMSGRVGLTVRATGTLRDPIWGMSAHAQHLQLDALELGNARLDTAFTEDRIDGMVELVGPGRAKVAFSVPIEADFPRRTFALRPLRPHRLAFQLTDLDLAGLESVLPLPIAAVVGGKGWVTVAQGKVRAQVDMLAHDVEMNEQPVASIGLRAVLDDAGVTLDMQASGGIAQLIELHARAPVHIALSREANRWVEWDADAPHRLALDVKDADLAGLGRLAGERRLAGEANAAIVFHGTARDPRFELAWQSDDVIWRGKSLGRSTMAARYKDDAVWVNLDHRGEGAQRLSMRSRIPISLDLMAPAVAWRTQDPHLLSLKATAVDEQLLAPFVSLPRELRLALHARVEGRGSRDDFRLAGRVRADLREGGTGLGTPVAGRFEFGPRKQNLELVFGPHGQSTMRVLAEFDAPVVALAEGTASMDEVRIEATAEAADFPLQAFGPLLPLALYQTEGVLDLSAAVRGPLSRPEFEGSARVANGAVTVIPLQQRLKDIRLAVDMRGGNIHLAQLRVVSGGGGLTAQGWLKLARGDTRGRLRVTAKDWPVVKPGLPVMKLDANVRADLDARGTVTDIDVVVRDSFLDVLGTNVEAPAKIAFAEDVVFVDVAGKRATAADQAVDRANAKEPLLPPNFRLSLQLENAALVRGPQVDMSWDGAIELARTGDAPIRSSGALEAEHGRVAVLGNDFRIESGRITLPPEGDLDPYIDLTAQTETPEALVTMTVRGRASRPELRLSSDPAMPESQVFALLLTGRTDSAEGVDESYEAKAASLLAAFQNPALQRALQDRVGIDRVGVGFGETVEQPIFTLGKRVTRNVYVETSYHHNAPREDNEVEVRLEYMFKPPSWSVDTYFGDAAEGGIGVWWRRRFGGAKKPKEPVDEMAGPDTPRGVGRLQP